MDKINIYIKCNYASTILKDGKAVALLEFKDQIGKVHTKLIKVKKEQTTRNAITLDACIVALECLKKSCCITIYMDQSYISEAIKQGWLLKWKQNNWHKANGKQLKHKEKWMRLERLLEKHEIVLLPSLKEYEKIERKIAL